VTLFVLLIAAGGAGAYWWFQPELPLPQWSTITSKWSAITSTISGEGVRAQWEGVRAQGKAPASATHSCSTAASRTDSITPGHAARDCRRADGSRSVATSSVATDAVATGAAAPAPRARLDVAGDSLTQVVRTFDERSSQFARGQVLARGWRAA